MADKAVFLDRDDTLIDDPGYISDPSQVELLPGAADALIGLKKMGYKTIVVSNQSGVARGIVTEEGLNKIHTRLKGLLSRQGAYLDAIYYCPYHPDGSIPQYRKESKMRKPNPGMLLKAAEEMDIDLENSWMVGDSYRDVAAGKNSGCRTILINSSVKPAIKTKEDPEPDKKAVNIVEAANIIKMFERQSHISVEAIRAQADAGLRDEPVEIVTPEPEEKPQQPREESQEEVQEMVVNTQDAEVSMKEDQTETVDTEETVEETIKAVRQKAAERFIEKIENEHPSEPAATENITHNTTDAGGHAKTHQLLEDILITAKKVQRHAMFQESSVSWTLALAIQIVAIGLVILSVIFLLSAEKNMPAVYTTMGYAAITQLVVVALCLMDKRK